MVKRKTAGLLILVLLAGFTSTLHATAQFKMGQVDVIGTPGTTVAVNRFLGVPFAQAPMGPLRWAPPRPGTVHKQSIRQINLLRPVSRGRTSPIGIKGL